LGQDDLSLMREIVDEQLQTRDGRDVARVADIEGRWQPDGTLVLTDMIVGPQALAARVWGRLEPLARFLLRDSFEHRIPMEEIAAIELDLHLRRDASAYRIGHADAWVVDHILRFIPGNGSG
jgi:hypothetical protein